MKEELDRLLQELETDKQRYKALTLTPAITGRFGVITLRARIKEIDRLSHRLRVMRLVDSA
jgi:hypothetical protein